MSAPQNHRVRVREGLYEDKPSYVVSIDGDDVAALGIGPLGHAERGEGNVEPGLARSLAEGYACALASTLPAEPVHVALRATVVAHVTPEGVTEVHIVPDQEAINDVFDANGNDDATVDAALKWVNDNTWRPLEDLPASVVWEG